MSVTIQLNLPDALVQAARENGLLESAPLGDLLATELRRRQAAAELNEVLAGRLVNRCRPTRLLHLAVQWSTSVTSPVRFGWNA